MHNAMMDRVTVTDQELYPTSEHAAAAAQVTDFFAGFGDVAAVLLVGSCARAKASPDSCLDLAVLHHPGFDVGPPASSWSRYQHKSSTVQRLTNVGRFSHVDVDFIDGDFQPRGRGWTSGPDSFELELGHYLAHSRPLHEQGSYFRDLRRRWLPYYDDELRQQRLEDVLLYLRNDIEHAELYVPRQLHFQAFQRIWHAFEEFVQALFIKRRTYPIAYDKWIREQLVGLLELPQVYQACVRLFEMNHFDGDELLHKARELRKLVCLHLETSEPMGT